MKDRVTSFYRKVNNYVCKVGKFFGFDFRLLADILYAFCGTTGFCLATSIATGSRFAGSFLAVIVFASLLFLCRKSSRLARDERVLQLGFSILLASILILGAQLDAEGVVIWTFTTLVKIALLSCTLSPFINLLLTLIKQCKLANFHIKNRRKFFWTTFAILVMANLLVFLAIFPGVYHYDAGFEIIQVLNDDIQITTHFSVLYSLFIAGCVGLGQTLFHSAEIGFALYAFLQMLIMTLIATRITVLATQYVKNGYLYLFCLMFFGFFPFYTVLTVSSAQDILFGGFLALTVLELLQLVQQPDYWSKWYRPARLIILILLMCLFRNNGFYCVLFVIPSVCVALRRQARWLALGCVLVSLVMYRVITGPVYRACSIVEVDTIQEMMSIPSQQFARVYNYNSEAYSEEDLTRLLTYYSSLDGFKIYPYQSRIADQAKGSINNDVVGQDLVGYLKFWAKIGLKDPINYIEAFLTNTIGFWYPSKTYPDSQMYHPLVTYEMLDPSLYPYAPYLTIERQSLLPPYERLLRYFIADSGWQNIPLVSMLASGGFYCVSVLAVTVIVVLRRRWRLLVPLSLVIGLCVTLFLSPVALARYYYPLMLLLPIFVALFLTEFKNRVPNLK